MSGGSDPFSILNKDPSRGLWKLPQVKVKVNRYKRGVKPELEGDEENSQSSDSDNIFSDDDEEKKSKITHFSQKSKLTTSSQQTQQSQVISKNPIIPKFKVPEVRSKVIKKVIVESDTKSKIKDVKKETVLKRADDIEEVVVERVRRRNIEDVMEEQVNSDSDNDNPFGTHNSEDDENDLNNNNLGKRVIKQGQSDDEKNAGIPSEEPSEEESKEEDEEEEEDEDYESDENNIKKKVLFRPTFVKKEDRITLQKQLEEELHVQMNEAKKIETIKKDNKVIAVESERKQNQEDQIDDLSDSDKDVPEDEEEDPDVAYAAWKIRE